MSTYWTPTTKARHQVTRPEAVVQRLVEEDAFNQKRYNHPLGYIINNDINIFWAKSQVF